jgi:hypothetical protein
MMMNDSCINVQLIIERFPEYAETVQRLLAENEEFQALCADYSDARGALAHWSAPTGHAAKLAKEYRVLVCALEADILEALSDLEDE